MEDNLCESVSSVSLVITGLIPTSSQVTSKEKFDIHSMSSCKSIALRKKIMRAIPDFGILVFVSLLALAGLDVFLDIEHEFHLLLFPFHFVG